VTVVASPFFDEQAQDAPDFPEQQEDFPDAEAFLPPQWQPPDWANEYEVLAAIASTIRVEVITFMLLSPVRLRGMIPRKKNCKTSVSDSLLGLKLVV